MWPESLLVVLPTYNECDNIAPLVAAIRSHLPEAVIWIVDDNSPDGTGRIADELAAHDERVEAIHRPGKLGLGTAYVESFQRALAQDFEYVLTMDVDFSHDPTHLPALLAAAPNADLVVGSRYVAGGGTRNWPRKRRILSRVANTVARLGLGIRTHDTTGAYRLYRRSALECLDYDALQLRGYGFLLEALFQVEHQGLRVVEVPITFVERVAGASKMSKEIAREALLHIARRRARMLFGSDAQGAHRPRALSGQSAVSTSSLLHSVE